MVRISPSLASEIVELADSWRMLRGGVLNINGNLSLSDIEKISSRSSISLVQFSAPFRCSDETLTLLNSHVFRRHANAILRVITGDDAVFEGLHFLEHLPNLTALSINGSRSQDLAPLRAHGGIVRLHLGSKSASLAPLKDYKTLRQFSFCNRVLHTDVISSLAGLQSLEMTGQNFETLEFLQPLVELKTLSFCLGNISRLDQLTALSNVESLSFWRIRNLDSLHLSAIGQLAKLRRLTLSELGKVKSLGLLKSRTLEVIELERMDGRLLHTLDGLAKLQRLVIKGRVRHSDLIPLKRLPALQEVFLSDPSSNLFQLGGQNRLPFLIKLLNADNHAGSTQGP